jgi:hypothetical protein
MTAGLIETHYTLNAQQAWGLLLMLGNFKPLKTMSLVLFFSLLFTLC